VSLTDPLSLIFPNCRDNHVGFGIKDYFQTFTTRVGYKIYFIPLFGDEPDIVVVEAEIYILFGDATPFHLVQCMTYEPGHSFLPPFSAKHADMRFTPPHHQLLI